MDEKILQKAIAKSSQAKTIKHTGQVEFNIQAAGAGDAATGSETAIEMRMKEIGEGGAATEGPEP